MNHHAPKFRSTPLAILEGDRHAVPITGFQAKTRFMVGISAQTPDDEAAFKHGHHHTSRLGGEAAVDHEQVAINNAFVLQEALLHAQEEGGER